MKRRLPVVRENPPPTDAGSALYVPPTGTKEGRLCGNCVLWVTSGRCVIHRKQLPINASMVCSYHVYGQPLTAWVDFKGIQVLEPPYSGLIQVSPPGTACANCRYFGSFGEGTAGACLRVASSYVSGGWVPAEVDAYGCCAQWQPKQ